MRSRATSSATSLVWLLAKNPEWQDKLRAEALAVTGGAGRPVSYGDLGKLDLTEMAFKEALRLIPPVPSLPRRAMRDFEFGGVGGVAVFEPEDDSRKVLFLYCLE